MMIFKSMELTFCVKPNIIACAAIDIALEGIEQDYLSRNNFTIVPSFEFLAIPEHKDSILQVKKKLQDIQAEQENKA